MKSLPNIVTLARLGLIVPILALLLTGQPAQTRMALGLLVIAGLSDALDGWLARRLDACSPVGVFLDPLVDKVLANVLLVFMALRHPERVAPALVIALLVRELVVQGVRSMAPCKGVVIRTRLVSKSKFLFQVLCLVAALLSLCGTRAEELFATVAFHALVWAVVTGYLSMASMLWRTRDLWRRPDVELEER